MSTVYYGNEIKMVNECNHGSKAHFCYCYHKRWPVCGVCPKSYRASEQAYRLLGKKGSPEDRIFEGLKYSAYTNAQLTKWVAKAGITKDITFHCFRHTYATMQLSNGTDIFTVSKMLGHRELKTTQVYAKIKDQAKRAAADKIKLDF